MTPTELLNSTFEKSMKFVGSNSTIKSNLDISKSQFLDIILNHSESAKAVLTVIITSLAYKILNPKQDIRSHQSSIKNGYSGRTFDTKYITPFMKISKFPAMATSGWLTRSLEQKVPYNSNYSGAIRPANLKTAFLETIDFIENGKDLEISLSYLMQGLIIKRNSYQIALAKPINLPISKIIALLENHFNSKYISDGAARLPVLALYSIYQCLISEVKRFNGKKLLEIESHTSADAKSGRIGDIEIIDEQNKVFEAVEVKHGIKINVQLIQDSFEKLKSTQVKRYYLLSTADIDSKERIKIEQEIERIKNIHGCHVIANGLIPTLKYYIRLISDTSVFIANYVNMIESDLSIKFEHKKNWNTLISQM